MSRGSGMSGANNIPLGSRPPGTGTLAAAASSLGGGSLLNPAYLSGSGPPSRSSSQASNSSSSWQSPPPEAGRRNSKFGPSVPGVGPPTVAGLSTPPLPPMGDSRKRPNMDLIASINATLNAKKGMGMCMPPPDLSDSLSNDDSNDSAAERKRKRKSRWGGHDGAEKTFIPGMPTMMPQGLNKDQEEAYLLQLKIEDASRRLRSGDLGIPINPEDRSPSPEPIYSSDGKRLNTREYRKRKELEEMRHDAIQRMMKMNTDYKPPPDYKPPQIKVNDKVMIPQEEHPEINFVGLLIGPRGNTLKSMERDTGAKIIIRGKGSVKEGKVGRKDGQPLPGEDEPLHAYVTATNPEAVKKAVEKIKEIIKQGVDVPEGQNDLRRNQLRELALLNGTLREGDGPRCTNCGGADHKSWQCQDKPNVTNNVVCTTCGGVGHIAKDCVTKRPGMGFGGSGDDSGGSKNQMDEEYMSLMAELGEGPPPPKQDEGGQGGSQAWRQGGSRGPPMFGNRPPVPRPLMGPAGPRGPPPPPPGEYENGGGWGGAPPPPPPGTKPPSLMTQNIPPPWHGGDRRAGSGDGWNAPPPRAGAPPPPPPGMQQPPPGQWPPPSQGGYGMPPPTFLSAPPPPPPPGGGGSGGGPPSGSTGGPPPPPGHWGGGGGWPSSQTNQSSGPGPVPPPPRAGAGPPPGAPPYWPPPPPPSAGSGGGWQGVPQPVAPPPAAGGGGAGSQAGGLLSNLIGAPPPPPPPPS